MEFLKDKDCTPRITLRNSLFLLFSIVIFLAFYAPLSTLFTLSLHNNLYTHIMFIPFISGYLIYSRKKAIFSNTHYSFVYGIAMIFMGITLYVIGIIQGDKFNQNDYLSIMAASALIFWLGCFLLCYGMQAFKAAVFPLLFLILMVPVPAFIMDKVISFLLWGSAEVSYGLFIITGVPVFREGFLFHMPGIDVEVAKQCSGIRSSIALFITSILASQFFLKSGWRKIILVLSIFPITIFKNGMRIAVLSFLGYYVDISFLTDSILHKEGGLPFFVLALALLFCVLWSLRKSEVMSIEKKRDREYYWRNWRRQVNGAKR